MHMQPFPSRVSEHSWNMCACPQIMDWEPASLPDDPSEDELDAFAAALNNKGYASTYRSSTILGGAGPVMTQDMFNGIVLNADGSPKICVYCSDFDVTAGSRVGPCGVDRKNSKLPYVPPNCACACASCNFAKLTATDKEFFAKAGRISTLHPVKPCDYPTAKELYDTWMAHHTLRQVAGAQDDDGSDDDDDAWDTDDDDAWDTDDDTI